MMSSGRSAPRANGSPDQDVVQRASSRSRSQGLLEWACSPHTHANLRIALIATANNVVQCCRTNWLNSYRGRLRSDGGLNLRRVMSAYPQKRTLIERVGMSALCHKRTSTAGGTGAGLGH